MCGIAGYLQNSNASEDVGPIVQNMTDAIAHRGPDDADIWVEPFNKQLAFGHRRLSIIDLSKAGAQPMTSSSGRYVIVFNGEIYNFQDIRKELEALDHKFKGHSDTEVLLTSFEEWGIEATLKRAAGMFALALYDLKTQELTLARDRLGKKPLYFGWSGGDFGFSSELKSFLATDQFKKPEINKEAVDLYLKWRYVPDPYSIYQDIWKLPPSSYITLPVEQFSQAFHPDTYAQYYWNFQDVVDQPKNGLNAENSIMGLDSVLQMAVSERMISDVPLGAFLSGGVDSALMVSMMQRQSDSPVNSFTIAFDDPRYNEAEQAKAISAHLKTNHVEILLTGAEALNTVDHMSDIFDEPFGDPSAVPTYHVCRLARQNMTVALSGDGGDESFGGYEFYKRLQTMMTIMNVPYALRALGAKILKYMPLPGQKISKVQRQKIICMLQAKCPDDLYPLIHSYWYAVTGEELNINSKSPFSELSQNLENKNNIERMMAFDTRMFLSGDVLTKVDRCSMANSLEVRAPLLDHRVIEYAWGMDFDLKINGNKRKYALKELLKNYLPANLIDQKKQGFSIPHGQWLKADLKEWAENLLSEDMINKYGLIDAALVTPYWEAHKQGRGDYGHYLWTVVSLQNWATKWR